MNAARLLHATKFLRTRSAVGALRAGAATAVAAAVATSTSGTAFAVAGQSAESRAAIPLSSSFIADAAARVAPALVNISVQPAGSGLRAAMQGASGSGFVVDPSGLVLTNCHVVRDAAARGGTVTVTLSDGVTRLRGVVEHSDAISDIAVVRVNHHAALPAAELGSSSDLRPGEFVVALGAPLGLTNSVSFGIVSAIERTRSELGLHDSLGARNTTAYIQTDASINSGNSGGPLLDVHGRVIGVNTMKAMGMDGIAFAVPIDEVKRVVRQLTAHGRVLRPYLGLKFIELSEPVAEELNARAAEKESRGLFGGGHVARVPARGLYVMHVTPGSPAQRAGFRIGDTIVGMRAGSPAAEVVSTKQMVDGLSEHVGGQVELEVSRDGEKANSWLEVTVETMQT
mmetsp:Transcript_2080/g.6249  ORF Transcript_2080/g.6249 Transcript_2080/m.6249 type:complete len:399 (+) Transcript_2080:103-1299(+)